MFLERVTAGIYAVNCYIIGDDETGKAAVIDPGGDVEKILKILNDNGFELEYILLTHAHGDHIGGLKELHDKTGALVYMHKEDLFILKDKTKNYSSMMGLPTTEMETDQFVNDGDVLKLGTMKLQIIHTPGHTPGGICILVENMLFTGDTLFSNSIGRTDLEGGDYEKIVDSIKKKIMVLDDEISVFPGHGPATRIGIERVTNPYI